MDLSFFIEEIENQKLNVEGVKVVQKGMDIASHRWAPELRRNIYSVSKSFASIAVGMAIDEGKLKLSDKVTRFFERDKPSGLVQEERWDALTLEHLLTMNMGHGKFTRPGSVKEALSYELTREPGSSFCYDNTCTFLASAMLTMATGYTLKDYLLERLFRPLGISDPQWNESRDGYTTGATGLFLTTSEMAIFGSFLLHRGNWEGKQLVSTAWIEAATRTQTPAGHDPDESDYNLGYGYQFWICRHGAYRCDGKDGQFIVVMPALDAVVAINSDEENMKPILYAVWDHILPSLR